MPSRSWSSTRGCVLSRCSRVAAPSSISCWRWPPIRQPHTTSHLRWCHASTILKFWPTWPFFPMRMHGTFLTVLCWKGSIWMNGSKILTWAWSGVRFQQPSICTSHSYIFICWKFVYVGLANLHVCITREVDNVHVTYVILLHDLKVLAFV